MMVRCSKRKVSTFCSRNITIHCQPLVRICFFNSSLVTNNLIIDLLFIYKLLLYVSITRKIASAPCKGAFWKLVGSIMSTPILRHSFFLRMEFASAVSTCRWTALASSFEMEIVALWKANGKLPWCDRWHPTRMVFLVSTNSMGMDQTWSDQSWSTAFEGSLLQTQQRHREEFECQAGFLHRIGDSFREWDCEEMNAMHCWLRHSMLCC